MKLKNIRSVEGGFEFDAQVNLEETQFLVNFAVATLLTEGVISVSEQDEETDIDLNRLYN